ncbi:MAG: hypothetical protein OXH96_21380 [Spirochaetaceae bacterium]|nr:hypothetical protein [Spirochaetaceae bacterium]
MPGGEPFKPVAVQCSGQFDQALPMYDMPRNTAKVPTSAHTDATIW